MGTVILAALMAHHTPNFGCAVEAVPWLAARSILRNAVFWVKQEMNFLDSIHRFFGCCGKFVSRTLAVVDDIRPS
jgi:hypothetical protein